jgi:hypothetical protein
VLSYKVDGGVLVLEVTSNTTLEERLAVFAAICADAAVPDGAVLLMDVRAHQINLSEGEIVNRLRLLVDSLRPKLGPVCAALINPQHDVLPSRVFQLAANDVGLRVGLFHDEVSARSWLRPYINDRRAS